MKDGKDMGARAPSPAYNEDAGIQRFLIMACCSVLMHVIVAAVVLPGVGSKKPAKAYQVEVKYLETAKETAPVAAAPEREEARKEPEKPQAVDLTKIAAPIAPETVERIEEAKEVAETVENIAVIVTPVPPVENAIITPGGGLGSGADSEAGGGNSLFATGTGGGWGGSESGAGWGGGSGSPGSGGGTGGGYGSGTGNSRGGAGAGGAQDGVYVAGMPGITPPVSERTLQPSYPEASRSRGEQGVVLLKVEVLANGRVGQLEVEKSSGYERLDERALRTVKGWRFKPALKGREVVACWINIPVRFNLD